MRRRSPAGFATIEVAIILVILVMLTLIAWWVYQQQYSGAHRVISQPATTPSSGVSKAPAINNTDDLDAALQTLNQNDPDATSSDTTQLDTQTNNL